MRISLEVSPIKSFIIYEVFFNVIVLIITLIFGLSITKYFLGFLLGTTAVTLGFLMISLHVNKVIDTVISEGGAKNSAMVYFLIRLVIYGIITVFAFKVAQVNYITYVLGLFTLQVIIYFDHWLNRKIGGG